MVLPSNFDYDFLFDGIFRCLASEQALINQIGLSFITANFSFFTAHHRLTFFQRLVATGTFARLFIHWSGHVRSGFFKFLLYSIHLLSFKKSICTVQAEREVSPVHPEQHDHERVLRSHERHRQAPRAAQRAGRRPRHAQPTRKNRVQAPSARVAEKHRPARRRNSKPAGNCLAQDLGLLHRQGAHRRAAGRLPQRGEGAARVAAGRPRRLRTRL